MPLSPFFSDTILNVNVEADEVSCIILIPFYTNASVLAIFMIQFYIFLLQSQGSCKSENSNIILPNTKFPWVQLAYLFQLRWQFVELVFVPSWHVAAPTMADTHSANCTLSVMLCESASSFPCFFFQNFGITDVHVTHGTGKEPWHG